MSKLSSGILGAVAAAMTLGAIQYASGNDLRGTVTDTAPSQVSAVNRAAKGDRAGPAAAQVANAQAEASQTLSFRVQGLTDTSVLLRLAAKPVAVKTVKLEPVKTPTAIPTVAGPTRRAVACEPPVSVLTEVAKLLEPGRCVT